MSIHMWNHEWCAWFSNDMAILAPHKVSFPVVVVLMVLAIGTTNDKHLSNGVSVGMTNIQTPERRFHVVSLPTLIWESFAERRNWIFVE